MFRNNYTSFFISAVAVFVIAFIFPGWSQAGDSQLTIPQSSADGTVEVITTEAEEGSVEAGLQDAPAVGTVEVSAPDVPAVGTIEVSVQAIPVEGSVEVSAQETAAPAKAAEEVLPPQTPLLSRPLAIMVENEPPARPQSGLYAAKVLFEIQAEEVTRFMGIYYERSQKFEMSGCMESLSQNS